MKVVFLDVDGVLNNPESGFGGFFPGGAEQYCENQLKWDIKCVNRLRKLVNVSGAQIVLSSFWRHEFSYQYEFPKFFYVYGWVDAPMVGATKDLTTASTGPYSRFVSAAPRADEVCLYLEEHPEVTDFVILDDMLPDDFCAGNPDKSHSWPYLKDHYVGTDPTLGLTNDDIDNAIEILSRSDRGVK